MQEFKEVLMGITKRTNRTYHLSEVNMLYYFYRDLDMNEELISYLIEYCTGKGKDNIRYMKKVAENWHDEGITTVAEAKRDKSPAFILCYRVLNAMRVTGRFPAPVEIAFCERWLSEYAFTEDMVLEAAQRTIDAIHKPSFTYCEGILKRWKKENVKSIKDIDLSDARHEERKQRHKKDAPREEHSSYDMEALKKALFSSVPISEEEMKDIFPNS